MYEDWTPNQKKRWLYGWLTCAAFFAVINVGMIILMTAFPNLDKQVKMLIEISVSLPVSAFITMKIYNTIILPSFPDEI